MPRSFALGDHFENFIEEQVRNGRYNNGSEVVREGLRLLEDWENLHRIRVEEIHRSIEESRRDGRTKPASEVLGRLEAKYEAMGASAEKRDDE
ncbi:type II toxin-antitoxin system ParD family antitoxin (plasmid) [Skermanella sp. TT6]|uniref:Type II toxin-antitoxin system ParD family antitoxin n=1 Tax=Skermanella cutis TaxID=2775420 RepID=A0ABX7BHX5_9PROT|nr:type II toxin-antitoxin system ParD family antitoxin [Skermanella sp. TT6]QQP93725.1 type II toxin-antitoxin system ParD family antitoxin [Skermanella sp. TT6]